MSTMLGLKEIIRNCQTEEELDIVMSGITDPNLDLTVVALETRARLSDFQHEIDDLTHALLHDEEEIDNVTNALLQDEQEINDVSIMLLRDEKNYENNSLIHSEEMENNHWVDELFTELLQDERVGDDNFSSLDSLPEIPEPKIDQLGGRASEIRDQDFALEDNVTSPPTKRHKLGATRYETEQLSPLMSDASSNPSMETNTLPPVPLFEIRDVNEINVRKFNTKGIDYNIQFNNNVRDVEGLQNVLPLIHQAFDQVIDRVADGIPSHDQVRLILHTEQLDYPIALPFMRRDQLTSDRFFSRVEQILQSHESFSLDESVQINFIHVSMPQGRGLSRRIEVNLDKYLLKKKSVIVIQNKDELCLARALVVAKARLDENPRYKQISNFRKPIQKRLAEQLHRDAEVPLGVCSIEEVKKFQNHLEGYQINVVSKDLFNAITYSGPEAIKRIYIYHHDNHFDVITSMPAFFNRKNFCPHCKKGYDHKEDHICKYRCAVCFKGPCQIEDWNYCSECNRYFKNRQCYNNHRERNQAGYSLCWSRIKCRHCLKIVKRKNINPEAHHCGLTKCTTCKEFVDQEHLCYMRPVNDDDDGENIVGDDSADNEEEVEVEEDEDGTQRRNNKKNKLLFFDFETNQETGTHVPNLVVIQNENADETVFKGENCCDEFCEWLFSDENEGSICLAHYFQGFDGYFILSYLNKQCILLNVIMNGAKILFMEVKEKNIKFLDSMSFLPMKLAALPKTFGFTELQKGYFPHKFNTNANQEYVGCLPESEYFDPDGMSANERSKFYSWYNDLKGREYIYDMQKEILEYCRSDVDILRRSCLEFSRLFLDITGIRPFEQSITIAAACNLVFRKHFLQEETIAIIPALGYRKQDTHSIQAIKWLSYLAVKENINIRHARNGGEQQIGPFKVDGYNPDTNTVYEFHGCLFHGCLRCFSRQTRNPLNNNTMHELYERTIERRKYLEQEYRVIEKWECDLKQELKCDDEMKTFFQNVPISDPLEPRSALYGGRTNASRLYYEAKEGEKINYVDFTSLYPYVNKYCEYPLQHPEIITENFGPIEQYFGLIKCAVLPPRGLFHPVLPHRCNGKLMFPLCQTCVENLQQEPCEHSDEERTLHGTWVSVEVMKAIEKGYRIVRIDEVWHFPQRSDELFRLYIDRFLKIKQESSGYPSWCVSDDDKCHYIDEYEANEGIQLEKDKITPNPGLRTLAKLMLNSFWGKFAQRSNMTQVEMMKDPERFFDLLTDDSVEVQNVRFVNEEILEVHYVHNTDFVPVNGRTNAVIAAFTTAHARLKLYSILDSLGDRVLYYDTDSSIYISREGNRDPPLGDYLGQLTSETGDQYITTFVSGGPKNYAYQLSDGTTHCKVRGITLNYRNSLTINFDLMKEMVRSGAQNTVSVTNPCKIVRDVKTRNIISREESKDYRIVYTKRVITDDYNTIPYGY